MSWDFWAGYISGAAGIILGAPLDLLKVQRQAGLKPTWTTLALTHQSTFRRYTSLTRGSLAPVLGYGALNGLLFVTYNRALCELEPSISDLSHLESVSGSKIWIAGAIGGLASWIVSAPTELIKCRKQLGEGKGLLQHMKQIWLREGPSKLYRGGAITSVRDAVGYGCYFWTYEFLKEKAAISDTEDNAGAKIMLCGGLAGMSTWASIYPLDVIKTRLQGSVVSLESKGEVALHKKTHQHHVGALAMARKIYLEAGARAFFQGFAACSVRAFIVNAVQWYLYEAIMRLRITTAPV